MSKTAQNQINQIDIFSTLPDELLYLISEKLENVVDLVNLSSTNKRFNRICKDSKFNDKHHEVYDITDKNKYESLSFLAHKILLNEYGEDYENIPERYDDEKSNIVINMQSEIVNNTIIKSSLAYKFNKTLKLNINFSDFRYLKYYGDFSNLRSMNIHTINLINTYITSVENLKHVNKVILSNGCCIRHDISLFENIYIKIGSKAKRLGNSNVYRASSLINSDGTFTIIKRL